MKAIHCPSCGGPGVTPGKECEYCGCLIVYEQGELLVDKLICPACNTENRRGGIYCRECGQDLYQKCFACMTRIRFDAKHCGFCGAELLEPEAEPEEEEIDPAQAELIQEAASLMAGFKYTQAQKLLESVPAEERSMRFWLQLAKAKAAVYRELKIEGKTEKAVVTLREAQHLLAWIADQPVGRTVAVEASRLRSLLIPPTEKPGDYTKVRRLVLLGAIIGGMIGAYFIARDLLGKIFSP